MKAWLLGVAGLLATAPLGAAEPSLRVDIVYQWYGWGSVSEHWRIERAADGVVSRVQITDAAPTGGRTRQVVPAAAVAALEAAIDAAPVSMETAVDWVAGRMDRAAIATLDPKWSSSPRPRCSVAQRQAWARRTLTAAELHTRVQQHLSPASGPWTDDYPSMSLTVKRNGHPDIAFASTSQNALMLPWKQVPPGRSQPIDLDTLPDQWRPALSDAVVALLPAGEKSRARFTPVWLQGHLRSTLFSLAIACPSK